jgi:histidine triad (HIT) family protein
MNDCLFCGIVAGDVPAQIVDSDEHTLAFMDINPATRGHALVIPRAHSADITEILPEDLERTTIAAQRLVARMERTLAPDGFNVLNACRPAAWQTVFHFHLHVIPRYAGDGWTVVPEPLERERSLLDSDARAVKDALASAS